MRRIRRLSATREDRYRDQRLRSSRVQLTPSETARFYFPWGVFGAKQTACTVILLKVETFYTAPTL